MRPGRLSGVLWTCILLYCLMECSVGCTPAILHKKELEKYLTENKAYHRQDSANGFLIDVKYRPCQLIEQQELNADGGRLADTDRQRLDDKYKGQYYFTLSFSRNGKEAIRELGSFDKYSDMLNVFSFELGTHITAIADEKDTVAIKDYVFEQTYGMSDANTVLLAFDKARFAKAEKIVLEISEFGLQTGTQQFEFDRKALDDVPGLSFDNEKE